jgi:hypothetical protein
MDINLFAWIREGVKRAVLHGVSDAVGQLGTTGEGDEMPQRLFEALKENPPTALPRMETPAGKPKRLGRSLEQIAAGEKSA